MLFSNSYVNALDFQEKLLYDTFLYCNGNPNYKYKYDETCSTKPIYCEYLADCAKRFIVSAHNLLENMELYYVSVLCCVSAILCTASISCKPVKGKADILK